MKNTDTEKTTEQVAGRKQRLVRPSPRKWWITHSCGAWIVGAGKEIGKIGVKTQSMGKSWNPRKDLWTGPPEKVKELIALNIEQLGPPLKPRSKGCSTYQANVKELPHWDNLEKP